MSTHRKYQPIWSNLRKDGKVKIAAPKIYHRRIIKAVMKERYMDLEYKFLIREANKRAFIQYQSTESMIEFWIKYTPIFSLDSL